MLNQVQLELLPLSARVGVAVSGGADSVFLLHALHRRRSERNLSLNVVHVNHQLRGKEADADAEFVRELARAFGLECHLRAVEVRAAGGNLEQESRNARHAFFGELMAGGAADRVATGHTRSDQAETVLYRILRGSGLSGLAGILPETREGLVRPLLTCGRAEIREWLAKEGIPWREDATNCEPRFVRNRLRKEVLPGLAAQFNPRLESALTHLATLARDEEAFWREHIGPLTTCAGAVILQTARLSGRPALARRVLRQAIQAVKGDLRQIEFEHMERLYEMVQASEGHDRAIIPGVDAIRSFDQIRLMRLGERAKETRNYCFPLNSSTLKADWRLGVAFEAAGLNLKLGRLAADAQHYDSVEETLDGQRFLALMESGSGLELRNWQPGDQYLRAGCKHIERIKLLFQEHRIPLWERGQWPVLAWREGLIWAKRFGPAEGYAGHAGETVLQISEIANQAAGL